MPARRRIDTAAVDALLRANERVVTHAELRALGLAPATISHRIRPGGPWQRLLPGVVLAHSGTPTRRERLLGAVRYVGDQAVITGETALAEYGVRAAARTGAVRLLQPMSRQRASYSYVAVSRTRRLPGARVRRQIPLASPARALVDACREIGDLNAVRELVAETVQRRLCTLEELHIEIRNAARQRTALAGLVLREMDAGVRSASEAMARTLYDRAGVPQPLWNAALHTSDGDFVVMPDGYWEDVAAALEVDSMRWHLGPSAYQRTQERQRTMTTHGILVLPVAPALILEDPEEFVRATRELRRQASLRPVTTDLVVRRRPAA